MSSCEPAALPPAVATEVAWAASPPGLVVGGAAVNGVTAEAAAALPA